MHVSVVTRVTRARAQGHAAVREDDVINTQGANHVTGIAEDRAICARRQTYAPRLHPGTSWASKRTTTDYERQRRQSESSTRLLNSTTKHARHAKWYVDLNNRTNLSLTSLVLPVGNPHRTN